MPTKLAKTRRETKLNAERTEEEAQRSRRRASMFASRGASRVVAKRKTPASEGGGYKVRASAVRFLVDYAPCSVLCARRSFGKDSRLAATVVSRWLRQVRRLRQLQLGVYGRATTESGWSASLMPLHMLKYLSIRRNWLSLASGRGFRCCSGDL